MPAGTPRAAPISLLVSPEAAAMVRVTRCCSGSSLIASPTIAARSAAMTVALADRGALAG